MNGIGRERRPTRESGTDAYFCVKVRKGRSKRRARGHSKDHTTSMQLEESRRMTGNRGRDKPTKRQARTEEDVDPEVNGSGPRAMNSVRIGRQVREELG